MHSSTPVLHIAETLGSVCHETVRVDFSNFHPRLKLQLSGNDFGVFELDKSAKKTKRRISMIL